MITLTTQTFTPRAYAGETDLQLIADLINACEAVDQLDQGTSVTELRSQFADPDFDITRDLQLWIDAQDQLVGYGALWIPPAIATQEGYLSLKVHPPLRGQGLESQIIAWAEARLRQANPARDRPLILRAGVRESQTDRITLLEQHGFTITRHFYRMARSLADPIPTPQWPTGYTVRSLQPDEVEAWVELFNQTFIDHWNFHPMTVEQRQYWMSDPDYQAEFDRVAISPTGTFAALCLSLIYRQENLRTGRSEGWITDLGTRRGFRKQGLGRAMLLTGLHQLQASGLDTALLGVDTENPSGALRLYESVGFRPVCTNLAYCKSLPS
jgi:mycothiol synthase